MRGLSDREFSVFYLQGGRLRGAIALNRGRDILRARRLVQSEALVDPDQLRDEIVDLRQKFDVTVQVPLVRRQG